MVASHSIKICRGILDFLACFIIRGWHVIFTFKLIIN